MSDQELEKVTVYLTSNSSAALRMAAKRTGCTMTDTINRALQVYASLADVFAELGTPAAEQQKPFDVKLTLPPYRYQTTPNSTISVDNEAIEMGQHYGGHDREPRVPRVFSSDGPEPPEGVEKVTNTKGDIIGRVGAGWWYLEVAGKSTMPPREGQPWPWPPQFNDGPYTEVLS